MPSGVVDAFKNLIRHGKHHSHHNNNQPKQPHADSPHPAIPPEPSRPMSPGPLEAAQLIVDEERQARSKMPKYAGLENFELMEKMGDGAFSNVYKAIDLRTGLKVAVKVVRNRRVDTDLILSLFFLLILFLLRADQAGDKHLNPQFKKKPRVTERSNILKEVQIMRGIHHPSIIKLFSFSESSEHYFLVLELMEGGELFHQIVKLTYFSENLARHVILQVAHGIRYLHEERGVVHRDIKPENLLFERIPIIPSNPPPERRPYDEEKEDEGEFTPGVGGGGIGRVKIADFGLSKVVWNEETMTPCGTVGYTAPEIVKDERYSKSVDMWALGCVLYTLLCGFPPFYDESINVLTEKVARGYYTFLSPWWDDISHSAKDLITHLLCVDPAQRYTIDEFLAHPWCNAAPSAPPPPTPTVYANQPPSAASSIPLDSPLLSAARGGRAHEGRSPGLATLKEAFDITYAVHRMEEEGARRRKYMGPSSAGPRGHLGGLNEEDDEDDVMDEGEDGLVEAGVAGVGAGAQFAGGRAGPRDQGAGTRRQGPRKAKGGFQLDLDGATLLGRRHRKVGAAPPVSSPLSGKAIGSPLRMEGLKMGNEDDSPVNSPMHVG
ncbi:putative serine/Threonine protein kinases, catalytic domain [Lyophyllum shimeji]|uniref:Serine/Threonine protein kinases, catalytic domain n=1 Tax=Lyophyllum shimeji TaxID=47721 RepID=A0A9P3UJR4_LYOSH|nr:putative serine/Threonine protein kinases, catalytic domain [Lyophyllum shimeji]